MVFKLYFNELEIEAMVRLCISRGLYDKSGIFKYLIRKDFNSSVLSIAREEDNVCGYALYFPCSKNTTNIGVYVNPEYRRMYLGTQLVRLILPHTYGALSYFRGNSVYNDYWLNDFWNNCILGENSHSGD